MHKFNFCRISFNLAINNEQLLENNLKGREQTAKKSIFSISFSHNSKNEEIIIQLPTTAEEVVATAAAVEWKRNENLFSICIKFCRQTKKNFQFCTTMCYLLFRRLIEGGRNFCRICRYFY